MEQVFDDPMTNSMAIFKFLITMPGEGTIFIFGSWVCVADTQGGFSSHLGDFAHPEIIQPSVTNSSARISNQMRMLSLDQEEIQSDNFFNLVKDSEISHNLLANIKREATDARRDLR